MHVLLRSVEERDMEFTLERASGRDPECPLTSQGQLQGRKRGRGGGKVSPLGRQLAVAGGKREECQVMINISHGQPLLGVKRAGREESGKLRCFSAGNQTALVLGLVTV